MREIAAAVGGGGHGRALRARREEIKICQASRQTAFSDDASREIDRYLGQSLVGSVLAIGEKTSSQLTLNACSAKSMN